MKDGRHLPRGGARAWKGTLVLVTLILAGVGGAFATPAPVESVDASWTASSPTQATDTHDTLEPTLEDVHTGRIGARYEAVFTIPTDARNGQFLDFAFATKRIQGRSDVLNHGCGGMALGQPPTAPHQVSVTGYTRTLPDRYECSFQIQVGSGPGGVFSPGSRWKLAGTHTFTLDWECFDSDPITVLPVQCTEKWRTWTSDGSGDWADHTVTITYTTV